MRGKSTRNSKARRVPGYLLDIKLMKNKQTIKPYSGGFVGNFISLVVVFVVVVAVADVAAAVVAAFPSRGSH